MPFSLLPWFETASGAIISIKKIERGPRGDLNLRIEGCNGI